MSIVIDILYYASGIAALFVGIMLLAIGFSGFRISRNDARINRSRIRSWRDVFMGRIRPIEDNDPHVQKGMVYNYKTGTLEPSGRLSVYSLRKGINRWE